MRTFVFVFILLIYCNLLFFLQKVLTSSSGSSEEPAPTALRRTRSSQQQQQQKTPPETGSSSRSSSGFGTGTGAEQQPKTGGGGGGGGGRTGVGGGQGVVTAGMAETGCKHFLAYVKEQSLDTFRIIDAFFAACVNKDAREKKVSEMCGVLKNKIYPTSKLGARLAISKIHLDGFAHLRILLNAKSRLD